MPTWKKVLVSGSAIEVSQLNVGANQQITTTQGTTFLTGSFTGSFVGSGAGLTGVTATAIFPTTAKTDLASSDQIYINDGANKYVTYGNLLTDLAGTNLTVEGSDSLALASQVSVTGVTASFNGPLTGTASWATNVVNNGVTSIGTAGTVSGITLTGGTITSTGTITLGGSISGLTNSNLSGTAGITNANLANSSVTIGSTTISLGATSTTLAGLTSVTSTNFTGSLQGTASAATTAATASNLNGQAAAFYQNASNINAGTLGNSFLPSAINVTSVSASFTGSLTGALIGTASWATNATTAATANATTAALTAGAGLISGGTFNGSTARTFSVDSGSMLAYYSGSIFSTLSGGATVNAAGVVTLKTGLVSGSSIASGAQGEVTLTTNGVAGSTVDLGLQTTDSPQFVGLTLTGDLAVNGADITTTSTGTATLFNTNATTVNIAGAGTTVNIGNASGTTTIAGNAIVQGDFTVNGTTTYVNVQDLYVEDKFIVLASGSATSGDGGIIIDRGSDAAGNIAYGFDSVTDRWGFQSGLTDSTNTFDPTSASGVSGSFVPYLFTEAAHGSTKPVTGEFAVVGSQYMDAAGNFWVYTV